MASTNDVLELLVKIGVIGQDQLPQARRELESLGKSTEDLGKKEKEAAGFTETLHHNHRALHLIMHQIGSETSPALGHALGAALYGPIGTAIALGEGVHYITEELNKASEAADKLAEKFAEPLGERMKLHLEAVDKLRQSHAQLATAIKEAGEVEDTFKNHLDNFNKSLETQVGKLKDVLELTKSNALAQAKNPEEREAIEKRYSGVGKDLSLGEEAQKVEELRRVQEEASRQKEALTKKAAESEAKASKAEEDLRARTAERDAAQKELEDKSPQGIKARQEEAAAAAGKGDSIWRTLWDSVNGSIIPFSGGKFGLNPTYTPEGQKAADAREGKRKAELEKANAELEKYHQAVSKANGSLDKFVIASEAARNEAEKAKKRATDASNYSGEDSPGGRALKQAEEKLKADLLIKHLGDLAGLGVTGSRAGYDKIGGIVSGAEGALWSEQHGQKLTKEQDAAKQRLIALLESLGLNGNEVVQALEESKNLHQTITNEVIATKQAFKRMQLDLAKEMESIKASINSKPL